MEQITDFDKCRIVAFMECGKSNCLLAEKLSRCHKSIIRFLQKYDETGILCRVEGSGRKRKIEVHHGQIIIITQGYQLALFRLG